MKSTVELGDGILIEVEETNPLPAVAQQAAPPVTRSGTRSGPVEEPRTRGAPEPSKVGKRSEEVLAQITPIAQGVVSAINNLISKPQEVTVEFGLKFSAKTELILVGSNAEGQLKVTMKWTEKPPAKT